MKNKKFNGESCEHTAGSNLTSGQAVVIGERIGVCAVDISSGKTGTVELEGVFELASVTDAAFSQGDRLFWDVGNSRLTKVGTGNVPAGSAYSAKAEATAKALVRLDEGGAKQAANIAALSGGESPTEAEFNALLAALKAAGIMKNA